MPAGRRVPRYGDSRGLPSPSSRTDAARSAGPGPTACSHLVRLGVTDATRVTTQPRLVRRRRVDPGEETVMSVARRIRFGFVLGLLAIVLVPATSSAASTGCVPVSGEYTEHPVTGPDCL